MGPPTVIPYDRAAIALEQRGRIRVAGDFWSHGVRSGRSRVSPRSSQILQWASLLQRTHTQISQHGEESGR